MEELRSTDVLDKEIRADAERKAKRILEKADETAASLLGDVDSRVASSREQAQKKASRQASLYEKNVNASVPLEKERYTVSYIHNSLLDAMNEYFDSIGKEKRLLVLESLLVRSLTVLGDSSVKALYSGVDGRSAEDMLKKHLGKRLSSCTECQSHLFAGEAVSGFKFREGIILTSDTGITCRLSLDQKVKEIMDVNREELSNALFDGRISE